MSEPSTSSRPRQVTLAAWLIIGGSLVVVAVVFDRVAGLHTVETRESVERFLAEPPGSDLGVGVDGVLTLLRTISMVAAGCATAAAILGYHVLRRSRSARLALTVLAVPLFLSGIVTGGFASSLVALASLMLWLQPSRDWFRDGPAPVRDPSTQGFAGVRPPTPDRPPTLTTGPAPGQAPGQAPGPAPGPAAPPSPAAARAAAASGRPAAVLQACLLTWVASALAAVSMVAGAIAIALDPDQLIDEARRQNPQMESQGVTDDMLLLAVYVMVGAVVLWCLFAIVLAVLVLRRVEWARIVLLVSASTAAALSLVGCVLGAFPLLLPLVAGVGTVALLAKPDVRAWSGRPG